MIICLSLFLLPLAKDIVVTGLLSLMYWGDWCGQDILQRAIPVLAWQEYDPNAIKPPAALFVSSLSVLARVDMHSPHTLLQSQIPLMKTYAPPPVYEKPVEAELVAEATRDVISLNLAENTGFQARLPFYYDSEDSDDAPLVAIYNTHTSETYKLTDGVEHLTGKRGGVVKVAENMEKVLRDNYGIKVARSDKIHDRQYNMSYTKSEKTACSLIEGNPGLKAVFDIHRDMDKARKQCVVKIGERYAATILIIVGSDGVSSHPEWRKNLAFAEKLEEEMNRKYPGLCIGVRVYEGRYHQHLHQNALLLEIGGVNNTIEEACYSSELLAGIVAGIIRAEQAPRDV